MIYEDTICAPATSVGTGAISMIRVSGADCLAIVDAVVVFKKGSAADAAGYSLKYGEVKGLDDVVVGIYRAPNSYTGEPCAEICCHASTYIVTELLSRLCSAGCRLAEPGEFTRRAFVNGKMDLAQAEAVSDMIACSSAAQHRVALNQLRGGFSSKLASLRDQLLELTTLLELELDFSEEDLEFASRERLNLLVEEALNTCRSLADSFRLGNAISKGVPVAIVGEPNSGKSTLLNALLGEQRAIVSDVPGTTRDTVEETCVLGDVLLRFIDTAGIRQASDEVEKQGIARTYDKISRAQVVLAMLDASLSKERLFEAIDSLRSAMASSTAKCIWVLNKCDILGLSEKDELVEIVTDKLSKESADTLKTEDLSSDGENVAEEIVCISAKQDQALDQLRAAIRSQIGELSEDAVLVTNARHAEALRSAADSLEMVANGLRYASATDLLAEDLRSAIRSLGSITGQIEINVEEVLGAVFQRFCVGK